MWAALKILENEPGPISDDLLTEAVSTLARLQFFVWANSIDAQQLLGYIKSENIQANYVIIFDRPGQREELAASVRERSICKPLVTAARP